MSSSVRLEYPAVIWRLSAAGGSLTLAEVIGRDRKSLPWNEGWATPRGGANGLVGVGNILILAKLMVSGGKCAQLSRKPIGNH